MVCGECLRGVIFFIFVLLLQDRACFVIASKCSVAFGFGRDGEIMCVK